MARAGFSLGYAAPEVVQAAIRDKKTTIKASTALDAWSLGVLAVELFTDRPALVSFKEGKEKVYHRTYYQCLCVNCNTCWVATVRSSALS